jgi:isocitrate/isopropylmalate dehydrogenase
MLLRHLGEDDAGDALEHAVEGVVERSDVLTADLRLPGDDRPAAGTAAFTDAVIAAL